jgi:hypothetical protein
MTKMLKLATAVVLLTGATTGAYAQSNCGEIQNNSERLSCYDKTASPTTTTNGYRRVNLTDLKLDKNSMKGQQIEVEGYVTMTMDMLMLSGGMVDANFIMVDYKKVSRNQLRPLYECEMACHVTIRGRVESAEMFGVDTGQIGIGADSITKL